MFTKRKIAILCGRLVCIVLLTFANASAAVDQNVQYYKMISTVEFTGEGQLSHQVEGLFTTRQKVLSNSKVRYSISAKDLLDNLSFVVDRKAQHLSPMSSDSVLWAQVNNNCAKSLKRVTKANIGTTWKQSFDMPSIGELPASNLKFTLTAIRVENKELGEMIAVRALSEPFFVRLSAGTATSRINTVYLFDSAIEDVILSVSVFETTTAMNGFKETLRHEVATCRSDSAGKEVELNGLGKKFDKLVRKLGVTRSLKVVKPLALPQWAKAEGLQAAQVAGICSALACEGALNPVAVISMPAAKVLDLQRNNSESRSVNAQLAAGEAGVNGRGKGPWEWLVDKIGFWPAAGAVGAAVAVPVAAGGAGGGASAGAGGYMGGDYASP